MRKLIDYKVIQQQVKSFEDLGYGADLEILGYDRGYAIQVKIKTPYFIALQRSSDWREISKNLSALYVQLTRSVG